MDDNEETAVPEDAPEFGLSRLLRETFNLRDNSLASTLEQLLRAARLHLGMDVAFVSELTDRRRVFQYLDQRDGVDLLQVGDSDPVDESYCKQVVEGRLPELILNARELPQTRDLSITEELGIGAYVSAPIRLDDGSTYGTFCTFRFHAAHDLNERDLALIRVFARLAGQLIDEDVRKAHEEEAIRARVNKLLAHDDLTMVWQPIVDVTDHRVVGVESLSRFPPDEHRTPADWFDEAARVELAETLESKAAENALKALDHLPRDRFVTFNVSAGALLRKGVIDLLEQMNLNRVVLEITEHDIIEDYQVLSEILSPLRRRGLRLAVDDAGAGYASFRHILRLRPNLIKLDMSLVRHVDTDVTRRSLAASLVQFANDIGSLLVAEGVETREELAVLTGLGVHTVQGFYLYHPMDMDRLMELFP